uniref:Uncharacterized protein n=1 Tax=Anguilla anguilla TaxID=7936 RepID=A0A0E9QEE2_ANGAN
MNKKNTKRICLAQKSCLRYFSFLSVI